MIERMKFDADLMKKQREEQSPELTQFYREYYTKATDPATDRHAFYPTHGLCLIITAWSSHYGYRGLKGEMIDQFIAAKLSGHAPFGMEVYEAARLSAVMHKDPNRLEWVRLHIPELNK